MRSAEYLQIANGANRQRLGRAQSNTARKGGSVERSHVVHLPNIDIGHAKGATARRRDQRRPIARGKNMSLRIAVAAATMHM
jgi:hypothetical protein